MSNTFFWGLTVNDIKHAGWNILNHYVVFFAGAVAAVLTHQLAKQVFASQKQGNEPKPTLFTKVLAVAGGLAATYLLTKHPEYPITFSAEKMEKALKFLIIHQTVMHLSLEALFGRGSTIINVGIIIAFIVSLGATEFYGPYTFYALGSAGALLGSISEPKIFSSPLNKKLGLGYNEPNPKEPYKEKKRGPESLDRLKTNQGTACC